MPKRSASTTIAGMPTSSPIDTTWRAIGGALRRWRKSARSSTNPTTGATTSTATAKAGAIGQPSRTWSTKYTAAETNAWAPKARLKTPDVL